MCLKSLFHVCSFRKCFSSKMCSGKLLIKLEFVFSFFPFTFTYASSPTCVLCPLQLLLLPTSAAGDLPYGSTNNRCSMIATAMGCYLHCAWKHRSRSLHRHHECRLHRRHQEPRGCRFLGRLIRHDRKLGGHFLHHTETAKVVPLGSPSSLLRSSKSLLAPPSAARRSPPLPHHDLGPANLTLVVERASLSPP